MSTDKGFIKLYRDIRDHWVWNERPFSRGQAWIDLLLMVNHEEKTVSFDGHPVKVGRGQKVTSLDKLAKRWGWSRAKVRRFFNDLESEQMLTTKRNTRGTTVTVVNYGFYQGTRNTKRNTDDTLTIRSRYADGHKQERKRMKKNEEEIAPSAKSDFEFEPLTPEEIEEGGWGFE